MNYLNKDLVKLNEAIKAVKKLTPETCVALRVREWCIIIKVLQKRKKQLKIRIRRENH